MALSIYGGTGLIGEYYHGLFRGKVIERNVLSPASKRVLYFISTTDNFNIYEDPTLDVTTNLLELTKRLDACKKAGVTEFNFISSWYVYGKDNIFCHEDAHCHPNGFYPITKYAAERLVIEFCETFNIQWRILRLGNVYGTRDIIAPSKKRNALHWFLHSLKQNKDIVVFDKTFRDYLHVFDVCRAIRSIVMRGEPNKIYNVASGHQEELLPLVSFAKEYLNSTSDIATCVAPPHYRQSSTNLLTVERLQKLGFSPMIGIQEGIKDLCSIRRFCTPGRILTDPKFKLLSKL